MTTDIAIIQEFSTAYEHAYTAWSAYYPEADRDLRMYQGDQWLDQEKRKLFQEGRNTFVFNRIRRNINMITGYQRKNRLSSVVVPIEDSDQQTADQLTQLLLYAMNYADGYRVISDCFGGALKTGWNLCSTWVDYRDDPINGDIKLGREPYSSFIVDPYFTQLDWSDCNYMIRRKYLSPDQVKSLLPGRGKDVDELYHIGWERDDKFVWMPYQRMPTGEDLMAYNEYYQQKWKDIPLLVDSETGEYIEFDVPKDRQQMMLSLYPNLEIVKRPQRYIERHIIVNDEPMKKDINPYGLNEYGFTPIIAQWESESDDWSLKLQSLVRCQRDPQRESNRRRSQMIDILDSQLNSGWVADENCVVNPQSLFQTAQGKVIWKRQDARPDSLERIQPAQIPPSMFQMQELFDRDMMDIVGINDANFGITENAQESGIMMMLRQGASLVNLQDVFDNLRFAQKNISQKILKLVQQWSPEKVERILHEKPSEQFYNKDFTKYDIVVQEGMLTDTQKQMYFRQLVDLYQLTNANGQSPITPSMLVEAAPIQGKTGLDKQIEQNQQQAAQQAQQAQQVQEQVLNAQMQAMQAKAISDIALGKERFTRSVANMGLEDERASQAVQDRADAALSRVKAMKELQLMDDDRLLKYFSMIQMMEEMSRSKEEQIKSDDVVISAKGQEALGEQPQMSGATAPMQQQNMGGQYGQENGL